ncbi:hypothetical protein FHS79_001656 [Polymorphobacter multimanifer]|uniref:Uncharacterized protein n=1 Tax=Polymorphobacter multimanifer TaxID=1070431 RepID=A0A841L500_9SPHN|nr:hypothetical protein [Polymorphobacter multimanifer]
MRGSIGSIRETKAAKDGVEPADALFWRPSLLLDRS